MQDVNCGHELDFKLRLPTTHKAVVVQPLLSKRFSLFSSGNKNEKLLVTKKPLSELFCYHVIFNTLFRLFISASRSDGSISTCVKSNSFLVVSNTNVG